MTTAYMAWEYIEPMINANTGSTNRAGFWKCTKTTNISRESCVALINMPLTQSGYIRKGAVVELPYDYAWSISEKAISDKDFQVMVLDQDLS